MPHHRRKRPHIDKGGMDRGIPKADRLLANREHDTTPAKKPRDYCTKRKGPHDFVLVERHELRWMDEILETWRCPACGKKKLICVPTKGFKSVAE